MLVDIKRDAFHVTRPSLDKRERIDSDGDWARMKTVDSTRTLIGCGERARAREDILVYMYVVWARLSTTA